MFVKQIMIVMYVVLRCNGHAFPCPTLSTRGSKRGSASAQLGFFVPEYALEHLPRLSCTVWCMMQCCHESQKFAGRSQFVRPLVRLPL